MAVLPNGLVDHPTPANFPIGPHTVSEALESASTNHPDRIALIDGDRTWTFAQLRTAVDQAAASMDTSTPVVVAGSNSPKQIVEVFAGLAREAAIFFNPPPTAELEGLMSKLGNERCVGFTSGTSGAPKAVVHSERNILLPALLSAQLEPPAADERIGTSLSLAILNVMILGPLSALLRQSAFVVIDPSATTSKMALADNITAHSVTRLFTVATQLHDLLAHLPGQVQLTSLDRVVTGGSGASAETLSSFERRFGVRPTLSYGLTETPTGVVRESFDDPIGSGRGFPLPHIEVTIRTTDGNAGAEVPVGDEGEICLAPASTGPWANTWTGTHGYLADPVRTAALFADGVMHTGDLGKIDEDGAVSVTGRLTSVIIRGGMNIDPTAVEDILCSDDAVADARVQGFPDDRLGEKVGAVVVAVPGRTIDHVRLCASVRETLNDHSVPDVIIEWPELPRSALGKPEAIDASVFTSRTD